MLLYTAQQGANVIYMRWIGSFLLEVNRQYWQHARELISYSEMLHHNTFRLF